MTAELIPLSGESLPPEALGPSPDADSDSVAVRAAIARFLEERTDGSGRFRMIGRARKVSVSMPEDLTAAVQQRVGRGEFSQYVTEAVAMQLERDLVNELAELLEEEHGPVPEEDLAEARRSWPDV